MLKRVYKQISETHAEPCPFAQDEKGNVVPYPLSKNSKIQTIQAVKKSNYPMQSRSASNGGMIPVPNSAPLIPGETDSGQRFSARVERAALGGDRSTVLSITFDNSAGGAVDETVVIGDGLGLVGDGLNITPPSETLVIGGNHGANTLLMFKQIASQTPVDLHVMHTTANDTSFYTNGFIKKAIASLDGSTVNQQPVNFQMLVDPSSFNTNIRIDRYFRFQLGPKTGVVVKIPAGDTIDISFYLNAEAASSLMNLV